MTTPQMAEPTGLRLRRPLVGGLATVVAGLLLAACGQNGEATKSGPQIIKDTAAALGTAKSYRLQGVVPVSGSSGSFTFDVAGAAVGAGTFHLGGLTFQLDEIHGTDYVKSKTLWQGVDGGALQPLLANRWVSIPANNPLAQQLTAGLASLTSARQEAQAILKGVESAKRGHTGTAGGQGVVQVSEGSGSTAAVVYVATSGSPFPMRVVGQGHDYLNLSDFNQRFDVTAPHGAVSLLDVIAGLGAGFGSGARS
ncbi:MAG: LolA-like protein [Candidatus Dormibacteria bacterium]